MRKQNKRKEKKMQSKSNKIPPKQNKKKKLKEEESLIINAMTLARCKPIGVVRGHAWSDSDSTRVELSCPTPICLFHELIALTL